MTDTEMLLAMTMGLFIGAWALLLTVCIRNDGKDPFCTGLLDGFSLGLRQWDRGRKR